ncbi:probable SET and MYND domain-containing protein 4 [Coccomyxa sp. Obi]|nr:probable SET and MYND domain-containing protein 4 [Coccomyxa sp. Obi]
MCCLAARCAQTLPHLVLRAYRQVIINAIAITPEDHASAEDRLGLAIYPRAAMLNHACAPNVAASFEGSRLLIRAITDLVPGTVLRFCYGPQVGESIREVRRRQLMEQYHFWCRCSACEASDLAAQEAASVGLKCGACDGALIPSIRAPAGVCSLQQLPANLQGSGTCFSCGTRMAAEEQAERMARLSQADAAYNRACSLLSQTGVVSAEAINLMGSCLKVQEDLLAPNNQVLGRTHDALARAHAQHGDADRARMHAQRGLAIVSANYGDRHHVTQHQRSRLEATLRSVPRQ